MSDTITVVEPKVKGGSKAKAAVVAKKKLPAPMSKAAFRAAAKSLMLTLTGEGEGNQSKALVNPHDFSSGKVGFYTGGKVVLMVNGIPVTFQMGLNLTAIHSEEWPTE